MSILVLFRYKSVNIMLVAGSSYDIFLGSIMAMPFIPPASIVPDGSLHIERWLNVPVCRPSFSSKDTDLNSYMDLSVL